MEIKQCTSLWCIKTHTHKQTVFAKPSVSYLGCLLDGNRGGERIALKPLGKVNNRSRSVARRTNLIVKGSQNLLARFLALSCFYYSVCTCL